MTGANDDKELQHKESGTEKAPPGPGVPSSLEPQDRALVHRFVDLRQTELASSDRRAQVEEARIAAARIQEEHQFHFGQRYQDLLAASQSHTFKVTWVLLGLLGIIVLLVLAMAFFGAAEQRQVAVTLVRGTVLLAAGYGLRSGVGRLLKESADKP